MKIAVIPPVTAENPWQRRLYGALEQEGVAVVGGEMKPWWPRRAERDVDLVHLHWLESLMVSERDRFAAARAVAAVASIEVTLQELRRRRIPIAWTLHNREPHSSPAPAVHRWLNGRAAQLVDVMIVHSEFAAHWATEHLRPRCEIVVAPHPHYIGEYPQGLMSAEQVRQRYSIPPGAPLFLAFGAVQSYKRVPDSVAAFGQLDDTEARMLVIGHPSDGGRTPMLRRYAAADPRVTLDLRPAADDELSALFTAADFTVVNYEAFSSGVLMLALSFGCPVIAPADGVASETAPPPAVQTFVPGQLAAAMKTALTMTTSDERREAAQRAAELYPPERQARQHLRAYELALAAAGRKTS